MEDLDRREDEPDEEEIKRLCERIQKGWDSKQKQSRSVYKVDKYTVNIIRTSDIDSENGY